MIDQRDEGEVVVLSGPADLEEAWRSGGGIGAKHGALSWFCCIEGWSE